MSKRPKTPPLPTVVIGPCKETLMKDIEDRMAEDIELENKKIKRMVDRFLGWRLPYPWNPDGGISYQRPNYAHPPTEYDWPTGTNLFSAEQAEAMIRFMLESGPRRGPETAIPPKSLLPLERECCGTFKGSRHRATCKSSPQKGIEQGLPGRVCDRCGHGGGIHAEEGCLSPGCECNDFSSVPKKGTV